MRINSTLCFDYGSNNHATACLLWLPVISSFTTMFCDKSIPEHGPFLGIPSDQVMKPAHPSDSSQLWHHNYFIWVKLNYHMMFVTDWTRQFSHKSRKSINGKTNPDSKVHGANRGPTWVLSVRDGPHVGPMYLAIREGMLHWLKRLPHFSAYLFHHYTDGWKF